VRRPVRDDLAVSGKLQQQRVERIEVCKELVVLGAGTLGINVLQRFLVGNGLTGIEA
jgi:hypothetical protein